MTDTDGTKKVAELLKGQRQAFLTTVMPDGTLTSRPMALQDVEFDGDLWFFSEKDSPKIAGLTANPQVNVTANDSSTWISLTGTASVVEDVAKKKELWNTFVQAWFPNGPEDPSYVLIKVEGGTAEYWDTPGGPVNIVKTLAARVRHTPPDLGENKTVQL